MKILQIHSNFFEYRPVKKEILSAEKCEQKLFHFDNLVVLFTTVEKGDNKGIANEAIDSLKKHLDKIKINRVLIYPYAHLSTNLTSPAKALNVLMEMAKYAKGLKIEVYRAPFGWCKEFSISTKGHPLAEQFRSFNSKREDESELVSKALVSEKKIKSTWFIILPNAELIPVDKFDFTAHKNLEKFYKYEISKRRGLHKDPPHISLMKRLELADYEPASDSGNFRWYPKGRLIKFLLEQFVTEKMEAYGAMEVETPIMYDLEHPALVNYLNRFPARQYIVKSEEKEYFLRFSACFGQFLIIRDAQISYRQLPLKIYELTKYSFRILCEY
jgi:threonyl-tRNA synthetase